MLRCSRSSIEEVVCAMSDLLKTDPAFEPDANSSGVLYYLKDRMNTMKLGSYAISYLQSQKGIWTVNSLKGHVVPQERPAAEASQTLARTGYEALEGP